MKEIQIKIKLVEYLRATYPSAVFACEVPFDFGKRRADVVVLQDNLAHVFEIKSAGDAVERLPYQIAGYQQFFDFCFAVGEPENIEAIQRTVSQDVGILSVTPDGVNLIRKPTRGHWHDKLMLASAFPVPILSKMLREVAVPSSQWPRSQVEKAKLIAEKFNIEELRIRSRNFLVQKYLAGSRYLVLDTLEQLTPDEIQTITRVQPIVLSQ